MFALKDQEHGMTSSLHFYTKRKKKTLKGAFFLKPLKNKYNKGIATVFFCTLPL
jgi:hypothetical protein